MSFRVYKRERFKHEIRGQTASDLTADLEFNGRRLPVHSNVTWTMYRQFIGL